MVAPGTSYLMTNSKLFRPANAVGLPPGQFNNYLDYPTFNAGIDPVFGKSDVFSFPYDSRFPMLVEYRIKPQNVVPSAANVYRFSPGILSSVLPRFRVWSQGQHPYANCVPMCNSNCLLGGAICRGGEGGPLLEPGTWSGIDAAPGREFEEARAEHEPPAEQHVQHRHEDRGRAHVLGTAGELVVLGAVPFDHRLHRRIEQFHHQHQQPARDHQGAADLAKAISFLIRNLQRN